jgi:hypothetical protein
MKRKLRDAGLLSLLIFLLFACKKDPDPCESFIAPMADFKMYILCNASRSPTDTFYLPEQIDTLYFDPQSGSAGTIFFKNNSNFSSEVSWTVGGDVRTFTQANFFLRFNDVNRAGEKIDVEFRTKRTVAPSTCFPNDDGLDTVRKSIFLANRLIHKEPQLGRFQGYIKGQERDTFTISIEPYWGEYLLSNFPKGATRKDYVRLFGRYFVADTDYAFQQFSRESIDYCIGYGKNDSLFIEFKYREQQQPTYFVGVRQ